MYNPNESAKLSKSHKFKKKKKKMRMFFEIGSKMDQILYCRLDKRCFEYFKSAPLVMALRIFFKAWLVK